MQEQTAGRVCKKCLLREYDAEVYQNKLVRVLELMDPEEKAGEELYEKRLLICKACEKLSAGTCLGCGCYVELRAAVRKNKCPYKYW